jgi:ParB-like chromosome segregation protein Spo0J
MPKLQSYPLSPAKPVSQALREYYLAAENKLDFIQQARTVLAELSPMKHQPVDNVRWVLLEKVRPNDYNPNTVASMEMRLLYTSIQHDGLTQPIVTVYDPQTDEYIVVDGFHRYFVTKNNADLRERQNGLLPIVVIDKPVNDRMASTIRHNRARGKHSVAGMASMVFQMLDNGWQDEAICNELGMEAEELLRLKHITGFSKLFKDVEYRKSWMARRQIKMRRQYEESQKCLEK